MKVHYAYATWCLCQHVSPAGLARSQVYAVTDGKYHMLPSGELLVQRVDEADKYRSYQCRAMNRLTQTPLLSVGRARFSVTGKPSFDLTLNLLQNKNCPYLNLNAGCSLWKLLNQEL